MRRCRDHNDEIDRRFDELLRTAMEEFGRKQEILSEAIHDYPIYCFDLEDCTLEFSGPGREPVTESIVPIATYLPQQEDWLWVWANDSLPPEARERSSRLRALSDKTGYKIFISPSMEISQCEIDELCAIALHELGGKGVFKLKDDEPWCFVVIEGKE